MFRLNTCFLVVLRVESSVEVTEVVQREVLELPPGARFRGAPPRACMRQAMSSQVILGLSPRYFIRRRRVPAWFREPGRNIDACQNRGKPS